MSVGQDLYVVKKGNLFYGRLVGGYTLITVSQGLWGIFRKIKNKSLGCEMMRDSFEKWYKEEMDFWENKDIILKGEGSLKGVWKKWNKKVDVIVYQSAPRKLASLREMDKDKVIVIEVDLEKKWKDFEAEEEGMKEGRRKRKGKKDE